MVLVYMRLLMYINDPIVQGRLLWLPRVDFGRFEFSNHRVACRRTSMHVCRLGLCRRDLVVCARPPDRKIRRYDDTVRPYDPFAEAEQSNHEEKAKVDENRSHLPPAQGSESISWCYRRLLGGSLTFRRILCSIFVDRHKCSPR